MYGKRKRKKNFAKGGENGVASQLNERSEYVSELKGANGMGKGYLS